MTNHTGSSYSFKNESSTEQKLSLEQWHKLDYSDARGEELLETGFLLSPFGRGLCWGGIFALTSVVSATLGASLTHFHPVSETINNLFVEPYFLNSPLLANSTQSVTIPSFTRPVNLLLVGIESMDNSKLGHNSPDNSTAVLLLKFEPQNNFVSITSIPQDSQVEIPEMGFGTIREAYNYGGIEMVSQVVGKTLDGVEIDRYIKATPTTLFELIDLLGGVEVLVTPDLDDRTKQSLNSSSGWQTLDSRQIRDFILQDRQDNKLDRIQRKQILIEAIRQRLHNPSFAANITQTVQTLQNYLDTNLTLSEMESLLHFLHQRERDEVAVNLIPNASRPSKSTQDNFIISPEESDRQTSNKYFSYSGYSWHNIPIAIQNTTNNPELSLRVLEYLIGRGFYNVYLDRHSPLKLNHTEIIAQPKYLSAANYLQDALSIGELELASIDNANSELTIRLGEDAKFIFLNNDFIKY